MDTIDKRLEEKNIIFFDGVCTLCNKGVNFVMSRDKKSTFYFCPLQSPLFQFVSKKYNLKHLDSVVVFINGSVFTKSRAILEVAKRLSGLYPLLYIAIIIPPFLRNYIYDKVAGKRYQWFGKRETCRIPTQEEKIRFLE